MSEIASPQLFLCVIAEAGALAKEVVARRDRAVAAAAVAADRAAIKAHADRYCVEVRALIAKRRVTAAEADQLCRRISAFAEDIGQALHVSGGDHV